MILLDKKDILQRYKAEGEDEGFEDRVRRADEKGFYALSFVALLIMIYKIFMDLNIGDIIALLSAFIVTSLYYHYKETKSRLTLLLLIFQVIILIASLAWFVSSTL